MCAEAGASAAGPDGPHAGTRTGGDAGAVTIREESGEGRDAQRSANGTDHPHDRPQKGGEQSREERWATHVWQPGY